MIHILKGRVKDISDPINSGRIRVEIPGTFDFADVNQYPWITYVSPFPSGIDSGMFMVPSVGDFVILLGIEDSYGSIEHFCIGSWNTGSDKPGEATTNTNKILYKSVTGHTIEMDDTLKNEKFRIIDRSGQILEFLCQMQDSAGQRGVGNVQDGGAKPLSKLIDKAIIRLKDLYGSEWVLQSKEGDNKFYFTHKDGNKIEVTSNSILIRDKAENSITFGSEDGSEYIGIVSKFGLRGFGVPKHPGLLLKCCLYFRHGQGWKMRKEKDR